MCKAHVMNTGQNLISKVIKLSATVFFYCTILLAIGILIAKESRENLVNNNFFLHLAVYT